MGRPADPNADPVHVYADRVCWHASGYNRVGPVTTKRMAEGLERDVFVEELRRELRVLRRDDGPGLDGRQTIEAAYEAWLAEVEDSSPTGTHRTYRSRTRRWISGIGGNVCAEMSLALYLVPVKAAVEARVAENYFDAIVTALNTFVAWAEDEEWLLDGCVGPDRKRTRAVKKHRDTLRRARADRRARELVVAIGTKPGPRGAEHADVARRDGDEDRGVTLDQVPSKEKVAALSDAIERRESSRPPWAKREGRGSRGGTGQLPSEVAARISGLPRVEAAGGFRGCEALVLHTDSIDMETGLIAVSWQLDRYRPWVPGKPPPVTAPKGGKPRVTQLWGTELELLAELCWHARKTGGWIFGPTRDQLWWADASLALLRRGAELMNWEHDQSLARGDSTVPPDWHYPWHYLRHHYGSYCLAPADAGGWGAQLAWVSQCMGHANQSTTADIYCHPVAEAADHLRRMSRGLRRAS